MIAVFTSPTDALPPASTPPTPTFRKAAGFAFALFCAAMLGLAVGAAWMVAAMYLQGSPGWFAFAAGALLALATRQWLRRPGPAAAILAAFATLLAALYFNVLIAAIRLAANFDLGLVDAMRTAGVPMLVELARIALTPADLAWYLLAALLAGWLAWLHGARKP